MDYHTPHHTLPHAFACQPMQSINIYPELVTWKKSRRDGRCALRLAIDIDHRRATVKSLKRKILPDQWNNDAKKVRDDCANAALLNALIRQQLDELNAEFTRKQLLKVTLTKEAVRRQVRGNETNTDFYKFSREQIKLHYEEGGETRRSFFAEVSKMEQFEAALTFADVDYSFLARYRVYMLEELENSPNTVWKSLKLIRRMFMIAIDIGGIVEEYPFKTFKIGNYKQGIPDYLEWDEVCRLKKELAENLGLTETARRVGY